MLSFSSSAEIAEKGVLDLRGVDFAQSDLIPLEGEWEFYWNKLYSHENLASSKYVIQPDYIDFLTSWGDLPQLQDAPHQFGYATLRLKILCDEDLPSISLYLSEVYTSFDLYVNGVGFEGNGKVGTRKEDSRPYWRPSAKVAKLHGGENILVMHMSNFHHHKGGAIAPIFLGTSDRVNFTRNFRLGSALFLAGCLLIAGALAFGFYWFSRTDYTGLFFFLFCCTYMYRILGTEEYVFHAVNRNIPWSFTLRLEYISLYLSVAFYAYFIRNLIEPRVKIITFHVIGGISGLLALLTVFLPTEVFTSFIDYYLIALGVSMGVIGLIYLTRINLGHKTSYVTLFGGSMLGLVAAAKILNYFDVIAESFTLTTIGYVGFITSQAVALTIRFGRGFRESGIAAQAAAKSKDQFLNTMSHELRTPMSAILGMADMLELTKLTDQQKEKVKTIKKSGESLLNIIKDILSITEAGTGKMVLDKKPMSVMECLKSAHDLSTVQRKADVKFHTYIDPDIPESVIGDSIRLKQILSHLLSNAFKFTNSGTVELKAHMVKESGEEIVIGFEVKDDGIGISKNTLGKIFTVFSQGHSGNTRKFGGTGIGLAVVKQIVELMNGTVQVESEVGKGTKVNFTVSFEVDKKARQQAMAEKNTQVDKDLKILYAEDNPVNQKLMSMLIKTMGVDIDIAENGLIAWEMAREKNYHIILMDIQMPEMDGIEAARRIIEDAEVRPFIIAVTANSTISDKKRCFEAGMNDFLTKPVKADVLKEGIIKWQNLRDFLDENNKPAGKYIQLSS